MAQYNSLAVPCSDSEASFRAVGKVQGHEERGARRHGASVVDGHTNPNCGRAAKTPQEAQGKGAEARAARTQLFLLTMTCVKGGTAS